MEVFIRQEIESDYKAVDQIIQKAFAGEGPEQPSEVQLVNKLRKLRNFVPELSLVALIENNPVGFILFSRIDIQKDIQIHESLALAPVCVLPEYQGRGVGSKLIIEGHRIAKKLSFNSVILVGHSHYYPRFGYLKASTFGIKFPFDVPDENGMAIELVKNGLKGIQGTVVYPKEFFE